MINFTVALTPYSKGKHLSLFGEQHARHRSLCGYRIEPHPDGELSMEDWDARHCPQCAVMASGLIHKQVM